jgi:acetylornithine/N-succinyldiaminopimelate aminotransferase
MSSNASIIETGAKFLAPNYARFPVAFTHGEGCFLVDADGRRYLDLLSGLAVSSLGYGHPGLTEAIQEQAGRLLHTSNFFHHEPGARLAERLVGATFADRAFFCNSGAEANEAAIKMARRARPDRFEIVSVSGSFHGRTLGALAATGQPSLQEGFGPMPGGFIHVSFGDAEAIDEACGPKTAAVLVEPIVGEGGILVPPDGYLAALREICDRHGALLILDEVQTGNGRTGRLFEHEHHGVTPDIMTTAKGLAGGLPIGAVLASEEVAQVFQPGTHGTTFGANPVACAAALAVLDALEAGVMANAGRVGAHLLAALRERFDARADVVDIRGRGLMVGMQMDRPARPIVDALLARGIVANATAGTVLRFLPPLVISEREIDGALDILAEVL